MLIDSGDNPIQHTDSSKTSNKIRRNGGRKILYFNPPFSSNVKTKLGKKFLKLVKLYFPKSSTKYSTKIPSNYVTVAYQT